MNTLIPTNDINDTYEIFLTSVLLQRIEPHSLMHYFKKVLNKVLMS